MYKKWFLLGLLLPAIMHVTLAQVSMTLQVPPAGVLLKNQLWNMVLVNAENRNILVKLNLVLLDVQTNQPVITASSAPISLSKGARQLQVRDISPVQYAYSIPASRVDMDPNGMLPAGRYQACYTVVNIEKGGITMVENCIAVNVDPLSPPLLNTPADEERLLTPYPAFTWLPPTPVGLFNDLSYAMVVVEVLPGQGKGDAIQQNVPVNSGAHTKNMYWNYPASFTALDAEKLYAWRVVAMNSGNAVAMSDIWTFRVTSNKPAPIPAKENPYIESRRGQDAAIATVADVLRITYDNAAADTVIRYTISSLEQPGNPVVQEGQLPLRFGLNQLQISLNKQFIQNKMYLFRFSSNRNEAWSVKFVVNTKNN